MPGMADVIFSFVTSVVCPFLGNRISDMVNAKIAKQGAIIKAADQDHADRIQLMKDLMEKGIYEPAIIYTEGKTNVNPGTVAASSNPGPAGKSQGATIGK